MSHPDPLKRYGGLLEQFVAWHDNPDTVALGRGKLGYGTEGGRFARACRHQADRPSVGLKGPLGDSGSRRVGSRGG